MTSRTSLNVTFWGAARTVTGSMHLVQANGRRLLLDCGLYQGQRSEARQRNLNFPFAPAEIDAVILSHAHIDHCGNLPNLVRQGFEGPIYCTPATHDLLAVMLADSARIQEEDAAFLNRKRKEGEPVIEPMYERKDVYRTMKLVEPVRYERLFDLGQGLALRFVEAGHLLGSAMVSLMIDGNGRERPLTFTGDVGRKGLPILRDPAPVPAGQLLISESTYGGRKHPPSDLLADTLLQVVKRTVERGGKLLVPAFSLGRTQTIVFFLHQLMTDGRLPPLPVFVDSPLAAAASEVYWFHPECFDVETSLLLADNPDLFGRGRVTYTPSVEESKKLNERKEPCIIIAASGMCESGRILHHLKNNIGNEKNTVLIIGFQAPETLGRRLVEGRPEVRILGKMYPLRAEVAVLNGFSSHADHDDLLTCLAPLVGQAKQVCLVHGDPQPAEALAAGLREKGFTDVRIPERGESVTLG